MKSIASTKGKGWLRDLPDYRDNTPKTTSLNEKQVARGAKDSVNEILSKVNTAGSKTKKTSRYNRRRRRAYD